MRAEPPYALVVCRVYTILTYGLHRMIRRRVDLVGAHRDIKNNRCAHPN